MRIRILFWLAFAAGISGCSQHYFDRPQPVGAKNIYTFPEAMRGVWTDGKDSLIVAKFFFANIEYKNMVMAYTKADTTRYTMFKNGKVYPYDSVQQKVLGIGYPYEIKNDSIVYQTREVLEAQLGRRAFLRVVGNHLLLNIKNENEWWELFLLSVTEKKKVLVRYPNIDLMIDQEIYPVFSNGEEDFFEVQWSAERLRNLIDKNVFADTLLYLDQQY